jgi:AcrR family transcriptional regulator
MNVNHQARAAAAELRRSRTRARLIEAAMRVIAANGPGSVSVSEIAAASGLSRGAFYNYFPHPDDLVAAVADKMHNDLRDIAAMEGEGASDPAEQLARICLRYYQFALSDPVWGWVWVQTDASTSAPRRLVSERFEALFNRAVELGRFRPLHPAAAASVAFGSVRLAVRLALTRPEAPAGLARETVLIVLIGLGLPEPDARAVMERVGWRLQGDRPSVGQSIG